MIHEPAIRTADPTALRDLGERLESLRLLIQSLEDWRVSQATYAATPLDVRQGLDYAERLARQAIDAKLLGTSAVDHKLGHLRDVLREEVLRPLEAWAEGADEDTKKALGAMLAAWDSYGS